MYWIAKIVYSVATTFSIRLNSETEVEQFWAKYHNAFNVVITAYVKEA